MNRRAVILTAFILSCLLLFSSCADAPTVSEPAMTDPVVSDSVTENPVVTLDTVRAEAPSDLSSDTPYYDAACYALYNGYLSAENGEFLPDSVIGYPEAVDAIERLTEEDAELRADSDKALTRIQLVRLLYGAASSLGISVETSLDTLGFPDADTLDEASEKAALWACEKGLLDKLAGYRLLPETAVSRLQFALLLTGFDALDGENTLAAEIWTSLPSRRTEPTTAAKREEIQNIVNSVAEKYGAVGLQATVIEKGAVADTFAYGWATKDEALMTADHKLRVASITKVALGIAAQLMREEGKIGLDESIGEYWGFEIQNPHFPDDPITIRSILTHSSSIANVSLSTPRDYDYLKKKLQSDGFSPNKPGNIAKWSYNNHAFAVLGVTLELAADETLDGYLGRKLFAPMDIDASFYPGSVKNTELLATVYDANGKVGLSTGKAKGIKKHTSPGETGAAYSGGLTASAYDIAKLVSLLASDGIYEGMRLVDAESVELLEARTENTVRGGFYQALPLRFATDLYGREGIYFHTGSSMGVYNCASYDPLTGDGVVVLSSGAKGTKGKYAIYKVCEEINQYIYGLTA